MSPCRAFNRLLELCLLALVLSTPAAQAQSGRVGDRVWYDIDADGVQDAGEPGYFGAVVVLRTTTGNYVSQANTDANGAYLMTGVGAGNYYLELNGGSCLGLTLSPQDQGGNDSLDSDFVPATFRTANFSYSGSDDLTFDIGVTTQPVTVTGKVWFESDFDGLREGGEAGVAGVTVNLYSESCVGTFFQAPTAASGDFTFPNFLPATSATRRFRLRVNLPGSRYFTRQDQGGDDTTDSDVDANGYSVDFTALAGTTASGVDAGLISNAAGPVTIGNRVWHDADGDGIQDAGETGYGAIPLRLYGSNANSYSGDSSTGGTGAYGFSVPPGKYRVQFHPRSCLGVTMSPLDQGGDDAGDSDSDANGVTALFEVYVGSDTTIDLGIQQAPASLTGRVFFDSDGDGLRGAGEPGIAGATVQLESPCWGTVATVASDSGGNYAFPSMPPYLTTTSDYRVRFSLPTGYYYTQQDQGGDDALDSDADTAGYTSYFDAPAGGARSGVDAGFIPNTIGTVRIGDRVWFDSDADGVQDPGEPGMTSPYFQLESSNGGYLGAAFTNPIGIYGFSGTSPGFHRLRAYGLNCMGLASSPVDAGGDDAVDNDFSGSPPSTAVFSAGVGLNLQWDLGVTTQPAAIGGQVWQDLDADGIRDVGEPAVAGMMMELNFWECYGYSYTYSKSDGTFAFPYVMASNTGRRYRVRALQSGFAGYSPADQGGDDAIDSDVDSGGSVPLFTLAPGGLRTNIGVGVVGGTLRSVGDRAWQDLDADGQQDAGETGLDGVDVRLLDPDGQTVAQTTTAGGGAYAFGGLMQQTYSLEFVLPAGFAFTLKDQGSDTTDSDVDPSTGRTSTFFLSAASDTSRDAGLLPADPASVGDRVWLDLDGDGIQDAGEGGVATVTVSLRNAAGALVSQMATDASGAFTFASILPGDYRLTFALPSGFVYSPQDQGGNDAADSDASVIDGQTALFTLAGGASDTTRDAGLIPDALATVGNYVWNDADEDGLQDALESGLGSVTVRLLTSGGALVTSTTTNAAGSYGFANLASGDYFVEFVLPALYEFSPANQTSDALDSDANVATGRSHTFNLSLGEDETSIDAGMNLADTTSPSDPAIGSTSPLESVWANDNTVGVSWSGAADEVDGSGVDGYSVEWNTTPVSTPNASVDVNHTTDPHATTSPALADGSSHYFHLSTCDNSGNCTSTVHAGPFWIDATPPTSPGAVTSSSHGDGLPHTEATIDVSWGAASDALSGLGDYLFAFDSIPSGPCTGGGSTAATSAASASLADGIWYAHVCATDLAGSSSVVHGGPYFIGEDLAYASTLVSHQSASTAVTGDGASIGRYFSDDGRYVAFSSIATDLVVGGSDSNGVQDAFLWDRVTNIVTLISHLPGIPETAATGEATATGISSDGAFVAFHSTAPDMINPGVDTNAVMDAFLWERATGTVTLISHQAGLLTTAGDEISYTANGAISANGQRVAIYSNATNLVAGATDVSTTTDALLWDRSTGLLAYVSHLPGAPTAAAASYSVPYAMSADGEYVGFYSQATNLISGGSDTNGGYDVFSWERASGTVVLVSHVAGSPGVAGNLPASPQALSADGASFLFVSSATDLVAGYINANGAYPDAFVHDRVSGTTELVSSMPAGATTTGNSSSYPQAISPNGRYVLFTSAASDLVSGMTDVNGVGAFDVFLRDRVAGTTVLLSPQAGTPGSTANNESIASALSSDGRFALYKSLATDLVAGMTDGNGPASQDVFLHDRVTGLTKLVSHAGASPTTTGNGETLPMALTPAGDLVLMETVATDLVTGVTDPNGAATDLYTSSSAPLDSTLPTDPAIDATSPVAGAWSADNTVEVTWSGATDEVDGSGLAGYSFEWNTTPVSTPDTVVDVIHTADPHSTTSAALGDGDDHYFHLSTCDYAGNCTTTVHAGPFWIDTASPGLPGAISSSSHDPTGTPVSDTTIDVAWGAASDGLSGVASYAYAFDGNPIGSCAGSSTASLSATSGALTDGSHYVHVCAVDYAGNSGVAVHGGPYVVDTAGPTGLVVSSSSHSLSTWSNDSSVDFVFSSATDANGVAGYAVVYDQANATEPTCTTTQAGTTFTGISSPDGDLWRIHVRARDVAGNCGATVHLGPFWIDTAAPGAPGAVSSSSHDGGPTNDTTIDVAWAAATDALSGIDGYSFFFNGVDQDCDLTMDSDDDERTASSPPLAAGSSYFHACAVDLAGNWGAVTTGGPYVIDLSAPHVTTVDSVATSGGAIGEGEVVNVEITQMLVSFDEAMDATLAESLGNYMLIFGGSDGTVDTTICGPLQGDDQSVSIDSISYAGQTSTLEVNGPTVLADGSYLFLVCASLEDVAGNTLDGDGNGSGGDDFSRSFRVDLARPTVTVVQTVADTGDGVLSEDEPTNVAITELLVTFSEEVLGGDSTASFLLLEGGVDGTLDTTACGPLAGDDASVVLDSAVYSSLSLTSTLALNGGVALADGNYRLLVCGTVTDLAGNALDDDDDGDSNDDFARNFVVDTVRPTNPTTISSSTHVLGAWSSLTGFAAEWSGGADDRSGLAGYSVVIDGNPSTAVDCTIEVPDSAGTGATAATLGEGAKHVHVRLVDRAGNCASGVAENGFWGIDTSAPTAPGAISSSSHDPTGTPVSDDTIDVAWGAASDTFAGVAGYSYAFDGNPTGSCLGSSTASLSATSGALADGSWYVHVCAVDFAGTVGTPAHSGAWIVDRLPPEALVVSSPSHSPSTWSNDSSVDFVFSGATDANGVAGYAVVYDQASATEPTCTTTQAGSTFTGSSSPDGDHWSIHVRARDAAGNCGDTVHFGPLWIDTTAPGAPGAITSGSHDGGPTNNPTIDVAWGAATDALSGIDGYSYFFNGVDDDCDGTMDSDDDERATSSPPLAAGTWYFHVCAVDLAGNWGAVTTGGPYVIDLSAPHVTTVDSVATSGGAIGEGEVVNVEITQLLVSFDEAMDATLAQGVSNYLLIFGGSDGTVDTAVCGPLQGDDQNVSIDSISYAGQTSTLAVNGPTGLADGTYLFLVCASLEDVAGNTLDGDGNGSGGDDFSRSFRVDLTPPTVALVGTVADTGDGELTELEPTNVAITELLVTFDEEVVGGDSSASFLLVEGGVDGELDTSACGPLVGDDTNLPIDSAAYSSLTSTLALNGGAALPDGEYRLLACATLTDLGGNAIDDDDDGDSNDDFARSFTVDTVPPTNPTTISSSTHVLGAWSPVTGFAAQWSGGTDDRSGLAGYSVVIDGNPSTAVDCTIEVPDSAGTGATAATLGEGAKFVHVRLVDRAGNCAVGEAEEGFWGIDTSAPAAPGAISSPSHDPVSSPVSDTTIDVAWGAASDGLSGIAGYSFAFSADDDEDCDGSMDSPEDERTAASPPLADGSWYFHVCAVDLAGNRGPATHGGPWIVDTTPPAGLAVASTSHTVSTWSNDNGVDFTFSGATDANGVAGYAVVYDQASATEPACTTTQSGTTFTGSSSPDSNHWWIHVRARDAAGNCGATVHLGPFWLDTVAPGSVSGLVSTDHAVGLASIDPTIAMSWSAATDERSGVAGYSVQFSASASTTCDGSQDTTITSFVSSALAHGDWHVQVCARDVAGNWGAVTQAGPYTIDLVAPQVVLVDSVPATLDGMLSEGETTGLAITQLRLAFNEGMSTSVSLPTSYRLIAAGSDGFQTVSCAGGVSAQDLAVAIDGVSSLGGSSYRLAVNGGAVLPTGDYRLLACASLTDVAGNHLDGNGDTVANDDFVRNFTIDRSPPTVTLIETVAPTAGAGLDEEEATNVALTTFVVTFSEPVYDPIGHTNPDDVTNPGNYRLLASGGDGFQTLSCQAGVDPADVALAVDSVVYDGPTRTATLAVNGGLVLGEERYRLYVCGSAAIIDLVGLPLDGDGNGSGGDDFVRTFQVDTTAPSNPVLAPNLPPGVWTNSNGLVVTWSGATDDPSGAGLAGYSVLFDLVSGSDPGTSVDMPEAAVHQAAATLADGASHFFHLATCDRAGNCALPIETGSFQVDTQVPSSPAPVTSSSHGDGLPHSNTAIAVSWTASADQPGLSGVSGYGVSLRGAAAPPVCAATSTVGTTATLDAPSDGSYFVHACARDLAGNVSDIVVDGPYIVDTAGPAGLVVSSSSHSVSTWSNDNTVDFGWTGATDPSGIAGYAVVYDQTSATDPTCITTQTASTFTGSSSPDADNWWLHVRAIDGANNCGGSLHLGPFQVDTQSPAAPTGLASPSHEVGVASNDDTVEVEWEAAIDQAGLSGIDGYGFFFSSGEDDDCDGEVDVEEDVLQATSDPLTDGEHQFHLCAVDNAGNWSPVASIGPFVIDTAGAAVVAIRTVADTGDGELVEGESTPVGVTQLIVEFDGAMFDPGGDSDPADVTNPENYRLYQAGLDGAVQTVACGTAAGDDVPVPFAAVSYSAPNTMAALGLSGSLALRRESYRLLVCPTLEDDAGTPIAGFTRNFTVSATDLLGNPNFDHDLAGWVVTEPVPGSLLWSSSDLSSAPTSGSAEILTASGAGQVWALSQCFAGLAGPFASSGWTTVESTVPGAPVVGVRLDFFDGAGCSGALLDSTLSPPVAGDTGGFRTYLQLARNGSPEGALSVLVTVQVEGGAAAGFTVRLDDLFHGRPPALFSDGFESSDTSAWSVTVP